MYVTAIRIKFIALNFLKPLKGNFEKIYWFHESNNDDDNDDYG